MPDAMSDTDDRLRSLLRTVDLRPTRQRMALARLLFAGPNRHVSAEALYREATAAGEPVSLATVYNALHDFTDKGLLREITIDSSRTYFDTNRDHHHHIFHEKSGRLEDVDPTLVEIVRLPPLPEDVEVLSVNVIIRTNDD